MNRFEQTTWQMQIRMRIEWMQSIDIRYGHMTQAACRHTLVNEQVTWQTRTSPCMGEVNKLTTFLKKHSQVPIHSTHGTFIVFLCKNPFQGAIAAQRSYTEGVLPIHINDLNCTGSEERVWECPHNGIVGYSCNHYSDASVMCQGTI